MESSSAIDAATTCGRLPVSRSCYSDTGGNMDNYVYMNIGLSPLFYCSRR